MDLKSTYNKIAEDWHKDHEKDTWWVEGTEKFVSLLKPHATILDVGCGGGTKAKWLASKGLSVTGMDFSEEMVKIAQENVPEATFFVGDMLELDKRSEKYDAVFAQASLLHIPKKDVTKVLTGFKNILNDKGIIYIAVKEIGEDKIEEKTIKEGDYGYEYERFFSFFSMDELKNYLKELEMKELFSSRTGSWKAAWLQIIAQK
jgi:2-polyprenyl-3-methyl-5-hydroxy-6-metoxy-1,4-benzoquinol methylase